MYTPEEIREIFDEYQRHRALNIPVSRELAERVRDASVGVKNYTAQLEGSLNQLKSASVGLFNSMKSGKEGASVYNDSLRSGADLLATFLKALGPLGVMLGLVVKASAEYVAAVNEQSDALFDGYTELTKFGASFDTGVDGVYRTAQQLGYGTRELEKFVGLVGQNRRTMALFRGTVASGVTAYGDIVDGLREYEHEFRVLGMTIDDVNASVANYLHIQTMTGRSQTQTTEQLTRGAYNFIQNQLLVNRLTGETAEQQRTADEEMAANAVFQAAQRELRLKRQAALAKTVPDTAEAERLQRQFDENIKLIRLAPKDARQGLMEAMTPFAAVSDAAQKSLLTFPEATRMVMQQRFNAVDVLTVVSRESGERLNQFGNTLGRLGLFEDVFIQMSTAREFELMTINQTMAERQAQAQTQIEARKSLKDNTAAYAEIEMEQRRTREAAEDAINLGINAATRGVRLLTDYANSAAGALARGAGVAVPADAATETTPGTTVRPVVQQNAMQRAIMRTAPRGSTEALLELIGRVESRGNYNILVGGSTFSALNNMTVAEVLELQSGMRARGHESTAVGKYQIIQGTLQSLVNQGHVSLNERFSPATQDRLAIALLNRRGYQRYLQGALTVHEFADRVAMEWASFPMPDGRSFYAGVGSNKALVDRSTVVSTLQGYRFGGIAEGPDSGYMVELHGTEAVVPLPNGQSIPVAIPNYMEGLHQQTAAVTAQTVRLSELISIMRTRNQISEKILRAYQS
jgi:muramidase (phage lysozyme)